jgi:hypothetical protein
MEVNEVYKVGNYAVKKHVCLHIAVQISTVVSVGHFLITVDFFQLNWESGFVLTRYFQK